MQNSSPISTILGAVSGTITGFALDFRSAIGDMVTTTQDIIWIMVTAFLGGMLGYVGNKVAKSLDEKRLACKTRKR